MLTRIAVLALLSCAPLCATEYWCAPASQNGKDC
jgi:hypothetical protein